MLKIISVELEWLKFLKDSLEEDFPIVVPSHILFTYSDFIFVIYSESFVCLARMVEF